jgi:HEAT repeat protein
MNQPHPGENNTAAKFTPPSADDYQVPLMYEPDRVRSAPEIGGTASILAEFDAATSSDRYSQALQKLLRSRQNVVPDLLMRLEGNDLNLAKKAALALGYLRSPQAIPSLVAAAINPSRSLCWHAASALSYIDNPEAVGTLIKMLHHKSVQVQAAAAKALGRNGLPAASPLVDALGRCDDLVKLHAAHALGQIGSPIAVPALITALNHSSKSIRFEATRALGQIKSPLTATALAERLTDTDLGVQAQAAQALKNIGAPALPALVVMLKNPASNTRSVAARTLGQMRMDEVVPVLVEVLQNDTFPYVRCDAARALGEIGSHDAVFHLAAMLKERDRTEQSERYVRNAVIAALQQINTPEAQHIVRATSQSVVIPHYSVSQNSDESSDFTMLQ